MSQQENVKPRKYQPYPEYKDSGVEWLGEIPTGWNAFALKHALSSPVTDGPHETPRFLEDGVPFMSVDSIQNNQLIFDGCRYISREDHKRYSKKCLPQCGDLLLGKSASIGKIAYVATNREFNVWSPLAVIKLNHFKHVSRYYYYYFQSLLIQYQCKIKSNSNTQANLSMGDISNLVFAVPELTYQSKIAAFLDHETARIDTLITKQQRLIELLQEKRQAVISHAVTKGLNPNAPMKDSGVEWLGQVPAHWKVTKIGLHAKKIGSGKTPKGGAEVYQEAGVLFLRSQNVYDDGLRISKDEATYISDLIHEEMHNTQVRCNDVLLNITGGSIGRSCLVPEGLGEANVNQHVCILRFDGILAKFFALVMKSSAIKEQISVVQVGGNREGLNFEQISSMKLCLPPIQEINQIVDYLSALLPKLERLVDGSTSVIKLLQERRTALISAAVTGKIDLRNWAAPQGGEA